MFYSGNGCCGTGCNYALGVARSERLLGPWEKNPANPILAGNEQWRCPGHGSVVQDTAGQDWLLYHAYAADGFVATGRMGLLDRVTWDTITGWPSINAGKGPSVTAASPVSTIQVRNTSFEDKFSGVDLKQGWNWPLPQGGPSAELNLGRLRLRILSADTPSVLARPIPSGDFIATGVLDQNQTGQGVTAGLAAIGDLGNAAGICVRSGKVQVWQTKRGKREVVKEEIAPLTKKLHLRVIGTKGADYAFAYSMDLKHWVDVATVGDGSMPPWDRAMRAGFIAEGPAGAVACFDDFRIQALK
jgi:beta-xylosidase